MISCQSKSNGVDLDVSQVPYQNVIANKTIYPLRYGEYKDPLHSRIVLKNDEIKENWQPFKQDFHVDYMDVYFEKQKTIGFKGYLSNSSKMNWDNIYAELVQKISNDKNYKSIELKNNDSNVLINEWENSDVIVGLIYEKVNQSIAILLIKKSALKDFYDKVFYSEFLELTKLRVNKSEVHLKALKVTPSKDDKSFYEKKFKELKDEYNRK